MITMCSSDIPIQRRVPVAHYGAWVEKLLLYMWRYDDGNEFRYLHTHPFEYLFEHNKSVLREQYL